MCHHFKDVKFIKGKHIEKDMIQGLKIALLILLMAFAVTTMSGSVDAYHIYGYSYPPMHYGSWYGYPMYGYAGPYSYVYTPGSFWGHYYNPGLYYSALDYSLQNNLLAFSQGNLGMTYGFIGQNSYWN